VPLAQKANNIGPVPPTQRMHLCRSQSKEGK